MADAPPAPAPAAGLKTSFVHLHLHSEYSLLDGGNKIGKLLKYCQANGMDAVAVTDHGNLFGAAEFYFKAKEIGIKPILGIEAYVARDLDGLPIARTLRRDSRERGADKVAPGGHHLVLLAETQEGWSNLLKLSSDAFTRGFYSNPRMDRETLARLGRGLVAINGHLGSSVAFFLEKHLETKDRKYLDLARAEAVWHRDTFGRNAKGEPCFYLELQRYDESVDAARDGGEAGRIRQSDINPLIVEMARGLDIPLVCDNDAHFMTADDWDAHDTLVCISMGKVKNEANRLKYPPDLYVKTPRQMQEAFKDLPEAVENTVKIADRCAVALDTKSRHAPVVNPVLGPRLQALLAGPGTPGEQVARFDCGHPAGTNDWFRAFCAEVAVQPVKQGEVNPDTGKEWDFAELKARCDQALRLLSEAGLLWRYGKDGITEPIRARAERELKILADKSISAYFIIVWDFVNAGRLGLVKNERGEPVLIPCNARGSGVGTMIGFVLGLSNACPVKYGLLFERFTDPERDAYPDIDIDMCQDGRPHLIRFVREKYGFVAQIITYSVLGAKAALKDVGRVYELPLKDVDQLCKWLGDGLDVTLDNALRGDAKKEVPVNADIAGAYRDQPLVRTVYDAALKLEGMTRHTGVHAAGVIVATQPLDNICPLAIPSKKNQAEAGALADQAVTQWDGPTCEKVGLLKMDFLGLRTISIVERCKKLVREGLDDKVVRAAVKPAAGSAQRENAAWDDPHHDPLDMERLAGDDPRVLALFARGETGSVFQFESGGMRGTLMGMKPDRLEDLIAANALYRPGPMEYIPTYNQRKHGKEEVPQVHPAMDKITAETYGLMIYQEQVMQVLHELGGIKLRKAYDVIKAISKKVLEKIAAARADFVAGCGKQGVDERKANQIFDDIEKFAGYGFNKSHSTGYAIVAYQTAYLKTFFPLQYMAAVLTYESGDIAKVAEYLEDCKRLRRADGRVGLEVRPPDVNQSETAFSVVFDKGEARTPGAGHIRFGLSAVKGVGEKAVEAILAARRKGGPFRSLWDFCERVDLSRVNKLVLESLVQCGAFDAVHGGPDSRAALHASIEGALARGSQEAGLQASETFLFGAVAKAAPAAKADEPALAKVDPWPQREALEREKAVLGLFVSAHPLKDHEAAIRALSTADLGRLADLPDGTPVTVGGLLGAVKQKLTQKGDKMAFLGFEDFARKCEAVVFPRTYAACQPVLKPDTVVFLVGKVDKKKGEPNILVDEVIPLDEAPAKLCRSLCIRVQDPPGAAFNGEGGRRFNELRELLQRARGGSAGVSLRLVAEAVETEVELRGLKVKPTFELAEAVETVLGGLPGRQVRCELLGAAQVGAADAQARYGGREVKEIGFRSAMQHDGSCASINRY